MSLTPRKNSFRLRLREVNVPEDSLLNDLKRVANEYGNGKATIRLYDQQGKYDSATLKRGFGSWNASLERAGLSANNEIDVSTLRLFENIEGVWIALGRQPRLVEMQRPLSSFSGGTYQRRFASWNNALTAFIEYIEDTGASTQPDRSKTPKQRSSQGKRGVDLRTRFKVMLRDGFKCRMCGRSPATHQGAILHIDHVTPWSKNGRTEFENLQTLCDRCNLGKGNLEQ